MMIKMEKVCKSFGTLQVLKDIDLSVKKGEVVCIIGPSGSGKSTLLRCLNHLERITSGRVYVDGELVDERVDGKDQLKISYKKVSEICTELGMVFQKFNLFPHMTALGNVIEALITVNKMDRAAAMEIGEKQLAKVGLLEKKDVYPSRLSGGQKQRVAIGTCTRLTRFTVLHITTYAIATASMKGIEPS